MTIYTLETACIRILGDVKWKSMHELPPSRIMEGVAMLEEIWQALQEGTLTKDEASQQTAIISEAKDRLIRYGWFVKAKLTNEPPWGKLDWDALLASGVLPRKEVRKIKPKVEQLKLNLGE